MKDYNNCYGMPNEETMTKDKQAIQKMAEDAYPGLEYTKSIFVTGYTAAVEDMEKFGKWLVNGDWRPSLARPDFWLNHGNDNEDKLQRLKKEAFDLQEFLNKVKSKIKNIHADRKSLDDLYCERCETSPCQNAAAYEEDSEDD